MSESRAEALRFDLLGFCQEVIEVVEGMDIEDFLDDRVAQRAVERLLELIGEVAGRLEEGSRELDLPWRSLRGLRVVLAHAYHKVRPERLFQMVKKDVPGLLAVLEDDQARRLRSRTVDEG